MNQRLSCEHEHWDKVIENNPFSLAPDRVSGQFLCQLLRARYFAEIAMFARNDRQLLGFSMTIMDAGWPVRTMPVLAEATTFALASAAVVSSLPYCP
jgi:hypothetical protein